MDLSGELVVDVPAVTAAGARIQRIAGTVGDQPLDDYADFDMGDVSVLDAAVEFARAWDASIGGLADAINSLRDSMSAAVEAYQAVDAKLASGGTQVAR